MIMTINDEQINLTSLRDLGHVSWMTLIDIDQRSYRCDLPVYHWSDEMEHSCVVLADLSRRVWRSDTRHALAADQTAAVLDAQEDHHRHHQPGDIRLSNVQKLLKFLLLKSKPTPIIHTSVGRELIAIFGQSDSQGQHCSKIMKPPQGLPVQMAEHLLELSYTQ